MVITGWITVAAFSLVPNWWTYGNFYQLKNPGIDMVSWTQKGYFTLFGPNNEITKRRPEKWVLIILLNKPESYVLLCIVIIVPWFKLSIPEYPLWKVIQCHKYTYYSCLSLSIPFYLTTLLLTYELAYCVGTRIDKEKHQNVESWFLHDKQKQSQILSRLVRITCSTSIL